ncbi:hypothetical protein GGI12_004071 [Dipsacomyces acuminosporus]|nr:hypothetical protein GGI12_004071 [Dipsacomyces acuminosporus]
MPEYVVSSLAYSKAILHCAKYPSEAVHGLVLTEKKDDKVRAVDVVPIAHNWTQLTPMFDVALQQVSIYAKSKKLTIGGYYVAYEDTAELQLSASGSLLAKAVLAINENAVALVIDAKKLTPESTVPALVPYVYDSDSQWKEQSDAFSASSEKGAKGLKFVLENNGVLAAAKKLVAERAEIALHDFDEHLNDVSIDWLQNSVLNERIKTA